MLGPSPYRSSVSITLGFDEETGYNKIKSQSWIRSWRRLSRLQRTIVILLLVIACSCLIYIYTHFQFREIAESGKMISKNAARDIPIHDLEQQEIMDVDLENQKKLILLKENANQDLQKILATEKPQDAPKKLELPESRKANKNEPGLHGDVEVAKNVSSHINEELVIVEYDYFSPNRQHSTEQKAIIEAFQECWTAYRKYAWGHDEFHPLTKGHSEWFGVGLTIIDSLDTIIIMGLKEEYDQAHEFVTNGLTFDRNQDVNLFEITIRVLGGLLSAYHLTGDNVFKAKAVDLGNRLLPCFNSPSHVPFSDVNLQTGYAQPPKWGPDSSTSEVTTIQLEFRDLSKITSDSRYKEAVDRVSEHVHTEPKLDGLVPIFINAQTGKLRNSGTISVGARGDSYYEYLLKQWLQTGKTELRHKNDYLEAVEGMKKHLVRKSEPSKLTYIGEMLGGRSFSPKMDHLVCFIGGTLALGYLNGLPEDHLDLAKEITRTCYEMYVKMPTKLSPEIVYFNQAEGNLEDLIVKMITKALRQSSLHRWTTNKLLQPLDAHNLLRPETVESLFYMYRITKDKQYREWGWRIFLAFKKYTRIEGFGYSSISNVKNAGNPGFKDKLESFFLAETLKYLYLLFSDDLNLISLDKFVINTEGHPLPIYKPVL